MPQIGIADKQTLDLVRSEIGRVQTAGGWAGAVFDGCWLEDGKVKLVDYQEISVYGVAISGGDYVQKNASNAFDKNPSTYWASSQQGSDVSGLAYIGQEFVSEKFITKIRLKTTPSTAYCVSSAKFQVWSGTNWVDVQTLSIVATDVWQEFTISNPQKGAKARLLANENLPTNGTWFIYEMEFYHTDMNDMKTTGTATLDISPSSLYAWRNLYFKSKKPENTNITCAVKDTYDNVLIPNIADGGDLSSIDPIQYKTLRLVWTLTRNSTEDESPVVYEPFWSWLGSDTIYLTASDNIKISSPAEKTVSASSAQMVKSFFLPKASNGGTVKLKFQLKGIVADKTISVVVYQNNQAIQSYVATFVPATYASYEIIVPAVQFLGIGISGIYVGGLYQAAYIRNLEICYDEVGYLNDTEIVL